MPGFDAGSIQARLELDRTAFQAGLEDARGEASDFESGDYSARLDADSADFDEHLDDAEERLDSFDDEVSTATLDADDEDAQGKIDDIMARIDELSSETAMARVDVDDASAKRKLTEIQAALDTLKTETMGLDIDEDTGADIDRLNGQLDQLDGEITNVGNSSDSTSKSLDRMGKSADDASGESMSLMQAALALSPALGTIGAVGAAGIGAIIPALASAGLGLGIFAVAAEGDLTQIEGDAKSMLSAFQASEKTVVMPALMGALPIINDLFTDLTPVVAATSVALQGLEKDASDALQAPFWHQFFAFIGGEAETGLTTFGRLIDATGQMLAELTEQWSPLIADVEQGLDGMSAHMLRFGAAWHPGIQEFIDYVRDNAPAVHKALDEVGGDLVVIAEDAGRLGPPMLTIITDVAEFVGWLEKLNPELTEVAIGILGTAYTVSRLAGPLGGLSGLATIAASSWGVLGDAVTVGGAGLASVAAASPGVIGVLGGIATAGLLAVPGVDLLAASLLNATGVFSNFGDAEAGSAKAFTQQFMNSITQAANPLQLLGNEISSTTDVMNRMTNVLAAMNTVETGPLPPGTDINTSIDQLGALGQKIIAVAAANNVAIDPANGLNQATLNMVATTQSLSDKVADLKKQIPGLTQQQQAQTAATRAGYMATGQAVGLTGQLAIQYGQLSAQAQSATTALNNDVSALDAWLGVGLSTVQAALGFDSALAALGTALASNGASLNATTTAGLANQQAFSAMGSAIQGVVEQMAAQHDSAASILSVLASETGSVEALAGKYGLSATQVQTLLGQMHLLPAQVKTELDLIGYPTAAAQVSSFQQQMDQLLAHPNIPINIQVSIQESIAGALQTAEHAAQSMAGHAGGLAMGAMGAHTARVAEGGRELMFTPGGHAAMLYGPFAHVPAGAGVLNHQQTEDFVSGRMPSHADGLDGSMFGALNIDVPQAVPASVTLQSPNVNIAVNLNGSGNTQADAKAITAQVQTMIEESYRQFAAVIEQQIGVR